MNDTRERELVQMDYDRNPNLTLLVQSQGKPPGGNPNGDGKHMHKIMATVLMSVNLHGDGKLVLNMRDDDGRRFQLKLGMHDAQKVLHCIPVSLVSDVADGADAEAYARIVGKLVRYHDAQRPDRSVISELRSVRKALTFTEGEARDRCEAREADLLGRLGYDPDQKTPA